MSFDIKHSLNVVPFVQWLRQTLEVIPYFESTCIHEELGI
jgi:hypothetical protein